MQHEPISFFITCLRYKIYLYFTLAEGVGISFGPFITCKVEDFSSILVSRFCYSVFLCLSVCLSPTGHNLKPIVMKLYQVVEVVSTEKPIDFEVKGHLEVDFLKSSFFIQLT